MKNKLLILVLSALFSLHVHPDISITRHSQGMLLDTEYGQYEVCEPVICELIDSPGMQRLKHIHQYGVTCYCQKQEDFNRFDHSIGVFVLLRHYGASLEEQIAGLLHDVSHTVFSHVGDFVFNSYFKRFSYQDDIHEWYLEKNGIMEILKKYGYGDSCSAQAKKNQRMLEQDRPDICMDRVEYLLRGGLVAELLRQKDVDEIIQDLHYSDGQWYFNHTVPAIKLGLVALWLSENIFGTDWNGYVYRNAADALKRCVELGILSNDDIHFSTDEIVWNKMMSCDDACVHTLLDRVVNFPNYYELTDGTQQYDIHMKAKCLAIDPYVQTCVGLQRLTTIDQEYAIEYKRVNDLIAKGWYLKLKSKNTIK